MGKQVEERAYWLAWSQVPGIGPTLLMRLSQYFDSLENAWRADATDLEGMEGVGEVTAQAIVKGRSQLDPVALLEEHEQQNPEFWTPADADYPRLLLEIPDPPPILYYRGKVIPGENRGDIPAIALVGTRSPSNYGRQWTRRITKALTKAGFTIVSGLAEGVDTEAHRTCLEAGGRTIAVLGTGVNIAYPPANRSLAQQIDREGLILSEHPRGTGPDRANFPRRNRIIAGLSRATLVLEAPQKSGALITARLANDYNRDVYALPGSLDNQRCLGCLELIHKGAQVILGEDHLLEMLGSLPQLDLEPDPGPKLPAIQLPIELDQVFQAVTPEAIALDFIVQQTGLDTGSTLSALMQLEVMGLVAQLPGMRYRRE